MSEAVLYLLAKEDLEKLTVEKNGVGMVSDEICPRVAGGENAVLVCQGVSG